MSAHLRMDSAKLREEIKKLEKLFHRAMEQVQLLNNAVDECQLRLDEAGRDCRRGFMRSQHMQLLVLQGTHHMYTMYVTKVDDQICALEDQLHDSQCRLPGGEDGRMRW